MLIGHQKIWQFLKKAIEMDKLSHAYLFFGEESLGKRKLAKEFIMLLNCQNSDKPCQTCHSCQDIEKEVHPDLILIEPKKKEIQIAQIRELKYTLTLRPYFGGYKSVIVDEAQALNQEAYSCLLKTLEEPLGRAILILVSSTRDSLPKTILSRVEQIKFQPVNLIEIENYLKNQGVKENQAKEISLISAGKPGLAINYFQTPEKLEKETTIIQDFLKIKKSSLSTRFQYAKDLTENQNLSEVLKIWLRFLRNLLLSKVGAKQNYYPGTEDFNVQKLKKILNLCQNLHFLISTTNVNQKLALEMLMLEL